MEIEHFIIPWVNSLRLASACGVARNLRAPAPSSVVAVASPATATFLVPKLHLGTHLPRPFHCRSQARITREGSWREMEFRGVQGDVPKCNLGTR